MLHEDLQLAVGGTLTLRPTGTGRPSAASVELYDPAGTRVATPTATIDSVDTTLSVDADEGDDSVTLASATGVEARRHYVLQSDDGERLFVRVRAVRGAVVDLYIPLPRAVASGSRLYGTVLTAPVTSGVAATVGQGYEARWTFTQDGSAQRVNSRWNVVRSVWPRLLGSLQGLLSHAPHTLTPERESRTGRNGQAYLDALERASDELRLAIIKRGRNPAQFRSFGAFERVVYDQVLFGLGEDGVVVPQAYQGNIQLYVDTLRVRVDTGLTAALAATEDYDADHDGVVSDTERAATRRLYRIER